MSPLKDWLHLFAVSLDATVSAAIFGKFLLSRHHLFYAANSEMFRVNTFVKFLFFSVGEKIKKQLRRSIRFPL